MVDSLKLAISLEILQLLDIGTTEYVIQNEIGDEVNPLMRKNDVRASFYTAKLATAPAFYFLNRWGTPKWKHTKKLTDILMGIFIGVESLAVINNSYVIGNSLWEKRKNKRLESKDNGGDK